MALRAFQSNPSIGGFGGESTCFLQSDDCSSSLQKKEIENPGSCFQQGKSPKLTKDLKYEFSSCDAFAQIVKELVDNAVDACCLSNQQILINDSDSDQTCHSKNNRIPKRVRVIIEPPKIKQAETIEEGDIAIDAKCEKQEEIFERESSVLRVTVSDNGCGMENIDDCVAAFHSNKTASNAHENGDNSPISKASEQANESKYSLKAKENSNSSEKMKEELATTGRYGIGLTLCLLHAQRLVPNSCASITSATSSAKTWTRASYVVNADDDLIQCVKKETLPKSREGESGTAVSLLVPGGRPAKAVWPRLAEYFARFQLSVGIRCSLQVMAPTLSCIPLFVRPVVESEKKFRRPNSQKYYGKNETETTMNKGGYISPKLNDNQDSILQNLEALNETCCQWQEDFLDDGEDDDNITTDPILPISNSRESINSMKSVDWEGPFPSSSKMNEKKHDPCIDDCESEQHKTQTNGNRREAILRSVSSYLNKPLELCNVAHSVQPIRRHRHGTQLIQHRRLKEKSNHQIIGPALEVVVIVHGADEDGDEDAGGTVTQEPTNLHLDPTGKGINDEADSPELGAKMTLVRMVNLLPLLDGAEASACGLVQGIVMKRTIWNSFGLDVTQASETLDTKMPDTALHIPTFIVKDSIQVSPFFQSNTHALFETESGDEGGASTNYTSDENILEEGIKRKSKHRKKILPVALRLGNILVIAQIHAKPSDLPLPTLSKGRLPLNDQGIDDALEAGLTSCLRCLQQTNPSLLLSTSQLKCTEREIRYIPAVGAALATIVSNSNDQEFSMKNFGVASSWQEEKREDSRTASFEMKELFSCNPPGENDSTPCKKTVQGKIKRRQKSHPRVERVSSVPELGPIIEERLRLLLTESEQKKKNSANPNKRQKHRRQKEGGPAHENAIQNPTLKLQSVDEGDCGDWENILEFGQCDKRNAPENSFLGASVVVEDGPKPFPMSGLPRTYCAGQKKHGKDDNFDDVGWW